MMIANLLDDIDVRLNTDYMKNKAELDALANKVIYTGPIDAYLSYKLGFWYIVPLDLRQNCWTLRTIKATLP